MKETQPVPKEESLPRKIKNFLDSEPTPEQLQKVLFWTTAATTVPVVVEVVRLIAGAK